MLTGSVLQFDEVHGYGFAATAFNSMPCRVAEEEGMRSILSPECSADESMRLSVGNPCLPGGRRDGDSSKVRSTHAAGLISERPRLRYDANRIGG